jgi:predicted DCC family thiol-disulfide oxidoreductase YuxK
MTDTQHPIVLYDGVCGLCNRLVRVILRRDPAGVFRFAPLQGEFARAVLARHETDREPGGILETVYVVLAPETPEERLLSHSDAAVFILERIHGPLRAARWLRLLPRFLRDGLYGIVARHRYRWFGKYRACPLPEPQWKERFLQ